MWILADERKPKLRERERHTCPGLKKGVPLSEAQIENG